MKKYLFLLIVIAFFVVIPTTIFGGRFFSYNTDGLPAVCNTNLCTEKLNNCLQACGSSNLASCYDNCESAGALCYTNKITTCQEEINLNCANLNKREYVNQARCIDDGRYCCNMESVVCWEQCNEEVKSLDITQQYERAPNCRDACISDTNLCVANRDQDCVDRFSGKTITKSDTCRNGIKDGGEEQVDCGGVCPGCNYQLTVIPTTAELFADGKSKQDFNIIVTLYQKPIGGLTFNIFNNEILGFSDCFDSSGRFSPSSITTNSEGKASFTYTAPLATGKRFKNASVDLAISGKAGKRIAIKLTDPRPEIEVKLDQRSMIEGEEMNYADVKIKDEGSKMWRVKVETSIGTLIPVGEGRGGNVYAIVDTINKPEYHFNWNPPQSTVEMIDSYAVYSRDHRIDAQDFKDNFRDEVIERALSLVGEAAGSNSWAVSHGGGDVEQTIEMGLGAKSYYDQYEKWKGNVTQVQRDVGEIKNSLSGYETFLRSLSIGVEGLQTYSGTKKFIKDKFENAEETQLEEFLGNVQDMTIKYGCDSLQSGLRFLANLERESKTFTWTMPVHIIVEVTDEDGFTAKKDTVFEYTYHYSLNDN